MAETLPKPRYLISTNATLAATQEWMNDCAAEGYVVKEFRPVAWGGTGHYGSAHGEVLFVLMELQEEPRLELSAMP